MRNRLLLMISTLLLFRASALAQVPDRLPAEMVGPDNTLGTQSDTDIWRSIRQGNDGLPSGSRPKPEEGVLVNAQGEWWSQVHSDQIITYGTMALLGVVMAISIYFVLRGRIRIEGNRSGRNVPRFNLVQRVVHWFTACLFLVLTLTGLILLFGRTALIPAIGHDAFSVTATAAMQAHNLFGPVFVVGLAALFVAFVAGNFPALTDFRWLLHGGGLLGGHASAGRYNFGEKVWFWTAVSGGVALSISGFLLLFPDTLATRDQLQLASIVHAIAAIGFICFACGHIYLGTVGTEGTLEGMVHGEVDENWARTHHDLWLDQVSPQTPEKQPHDRS